MRIARLTPSFEPLPANSLRVGLLCLVKDPGDGCYKRAEVTHLDVGSKRARKMDDVEEERSIARESFACRAMLVDEGVSITLTSASGDTVAKLPEDLGLKAYPRQTLEVIVAGLAPQGESTAFG